MRRAEQHFVQPSAAVMFFNVAGVLTGVCGSADTPGVLLFYTLDGSRPAALQRGLAASSRKYREPILLPAGRVAVRAVAVTR